jgi:outer membrane protein OmpA-like peptidoglycan-associated protein
VRVQRCGTGTSCDCSPEHQLAAATNKIQRSASEEGAPLPNTVRRDMELAFSADFSAVRIHRSPAVDQATSALHARALTSGHDVLFRSGLFQPGTTSGNRLLAHELAHVIQQQKGSPGAAIDGGSTDPLEVAAEKAADQAVSGAAVTAVTNRATGRPTVQRKLEVRDPGGTPAGAPAGITNATIVDGYVKGICPDFSVTGGKVVPTGGACPVPGAAGAPGSCGCLCTMHNLADVWTILVDDSDWPHTEPAPARTVTVHSGFSGVEFGAWSKGSGRAMYQNWLVLAHEMCGHAQLFAGGIHPAGPAPTHGGRPSHDPTVAIETVIAAEHGIPPARRRGLFGDPHHGESFARIVIAQFPPGSAAVAGLPVVETAKLATAKNFMTTAGVEADIVGHTDQLGSAADNNRISRDRAQSVKTDLVGRGIAAARFIDLRGVGAADCRTGGPQPACRKVELFMYIMRGASITHP